MRFSWMGYVGLAILVLSVFHIFEKPQTNDIQMMTLWFQQLWMYQSTIMFLFVADTFYVKMEKK